MTQDELLADLADQGYKNLRVLEDGTIVGTNELMFTRALFVDLDRIGWGSRFCYEDRDLAVRAAQAMVDGDTPPLPGYIASRGRPIGGAGGGS